MSNRNADATPSPLYITTKWLSTTQDAWYETCRWLFFFFWSHFFIRCFSKHATSWTKLHRQSSKVRKSRAFLMSVERKFYLPTITAVRRLWEHLFRNTSVCLTPLEISSKVFIPTRQTSRCRSSGKAKVRIITISSDDMLSHSVFLMTTDSRQKHSENLHTDALLGLK